MDEADFENLLKQTMGLDANSVGGTTIDRAVRLRMEAHRLEQREEYWRLLRDSNNELQQLIESVVVPETWFFRDQQAFSVLAHLVTREWRPRHPDVVLRLLSMPCSTGEEPYSMVMTLLDAGLTPREFQVDAMDISAQSVARAKQASYGMNSFRGEDLSFRERYFQPTMSGYNLAERICKQVRFRQANMLSDDFRFSAESYDVIFCRNLLIYFDRATQEQAMQTLKCLLTNSGFLFVGSAEAFLASFSGFAAVNRAMSFAFRKAGKQQVQAPQDVRIVSRKAVKPPLQTRPKHQLKVSRAPSAPAQPSSAPSPVDDLRMAARFADAGRMGEAAQCCENHLKRLGPTPEALYLLGVVRDAIGNREGAAECYRKVLYLEPEHTQALLHLALLVEMQGDITAAERFRERARRAEGSREDGKL